MNSIDLAKLTVTQLIELMNEVAKEIEVRVMELS